MPRFSLIIPTLRRPDTLRHALATLVAQNFDDCEILVQNNGNDAATREVVQSFNDGRVRHCSSPTTLPMTENWDLALANSRGDFLTFLGDDDGLYPDACTIAQQVIDRTNTEIVSWLPHLYYWPNYVEQELRNRLTALVDTEIQIDILSSDDQLRRFYRFAMDYSRLPMVYNSFVRRDLIERARRQIGQYFVGNGPDVTSGIINAACTERFARITRPLSISGLSGHSTGSNMFQAREQMPADRVARDFGAVKRDNRVPAMDNLQIFVAHEMLLLGERLSLAKRGIEMSYSGLVERLAATINDRPGAYAETLKVIRELATRYRIDTRQIAIPPEKPARPALETGVHSRSETRKLMVVDGSEAGLGNIHDAIRWISAILPAADASSIPINHGTANDYATVGVGSTIEFSRGKSGEQALATGWGDAEAWGTWSIAKRATLRFQLETSSFPLRAELTFRPFLTEKNPKLTIICSSNGNELATWRCSRAESEIRSFQIDEVPGHGEVTELEFSIFEPRSPAELGLSPDTRQLGIGIVSLSFPGP